MTQGDGDVVVWVPPFMAQELTVFWFIVDLRDDRFLILALMPW